MPDAQPSPEQTAHQLRHIQALLKRKAALSEQRWNVVWANEPQLMSYQDKLQGWYYLVGAAASGVAAGVISAIVSGPPVLVVPVVLAIAGLVTGIVMYKKGAALWAVITWFIWAVAALTMLPLLLAEAWNEASMVLLAVGVAAGPVYVAAYNSTIPAKNVAIEEENQARKDAANAFVAPHLERIDVEIQAIEIEILSWCERRVPEGYRDFETVGQLAHYVESGRADTIREALALYDQHEHYQAMQSQASQW